MYKVGVIGDRDLVMGFGSLGIDVYPVTQEPQVREAMEETARGGYAIVFIQERYAAMVQDMLEARKDKVFPNYCFIPQLKEHLDLAQGRIQASIEKALGRRIEDE